MKDAFLLILEAKLAVSWGRDDSRVFRVCRVGAGLGPEAEAVRVASGREHRGGFAALSPEERRFRV